MALPNDGMDAVPFTPLTAEFLDDIIENIEYLGDILDGVSPTGPDGWNLMSALNPTVTHLGNRSYTAVYSGVNYTSLVSPGARLKLTRTVTPPSQCADLELSSSQYFSKSSPAGLSFTTTFTVEAWVKLESYGSQMGIVARRNVDTEGFSLSVKADGTVELIGLRIAANNKRITSYQSLPIGKWVHVAATLDMTAADTTAQKIWFDGVEVPRVYLLTGTATALVQGTTALVVGATKSDGSLPFDGKIAGVAIYSSNLGLASVRAHMNQGYSGAESTLVSAYSLSNSVNDLNANANNLTAQGGALTTNVDSPYNATEYGIVMAASFSTDTTLTIQVPEGYTLPTSGGIDATSYSQSGIPYGFPGQKGKWRLETIVKTDDYQNSPVAATWYNLGPTSGASGGQQLTIPVGEWYHGYEVILYAGRTGSANGLGVWSSLSASNSTESDNEMTGRIYLAVNSAVDSSIAGFVKREKGITIGVQAPYYMIYKAFTPGANSINSNPNSAGATKIYADNAYL